MHIGRRDVGCRRPGQQVLGPFGRIECGGKLRQFGWRRFGRLRQEIGFLDLETSRRMDAPGSENVVGIRETDVSAFVIGEVEVVPAKWRLDLIWHAYQRRALNVQADTGMQLRRNNRPVKKAFNTNCRWCGLSESCPGRPDGDCEGSRECDPSCESLHN